MPHNISTSAKSGFANALSYDKHRPTYPPEAVSKLLSALHIAGVHGATVVDLAAGTGKFTEPLAARDEEYEITAIEPHERMRAELERKKLGGGRVKVLDGTAQKTGLQSQSVDVVITGQAWHWFSTQESLEEIYRILVPGGGFGMIWNIEDYNAPLSWDPTTEWEAKIKKVTWRYSDDTPRFREEKWKETFDNQLKSSPLTIQTANPLFSLPIGEDHNKFETWLSKEAIWDRYQTLSQIAILKGEELEEVKQTIFAALDEAPRNSRGEIALHGRTYFAWATAIPGAPLSERI